jgi:hypothetical protein
VPPKAPYLKLVAANQNCQDPGACPAGALAFQPQHLPGVGKATTDCRYAHRETNDEKELMRKSTKLFDGLPEDIDFADAVHIKARLGSPVAQT